SQRARPRTASGSSSTRALAWSSGTARMPPRPNTPSSWRIHSDGCRGSIRHLPSRCTLSPERRYTPSPRQTNPGPPAPKPPASGLPTQPGKRSAAAGESPIQSTRAGCPACAPPWSAALKRERLCGDGDEGGTPAAATVADGAGGAGGSSTDPTPEGGGG